MNSVKGAMSNVKGAMDNVKGLLRLSCRDLDKDLYVA